VHVVEVGEDAAEQIAIGGSVSTSDGTPIRLRLMPPPPDPTSSTRPETNGCIFDQTKP
jgi:hypothetical protein